MQKLYYVVEKFNGVVENVLAVFPNEATAHIVKRLATVSKLDKHTTFEVGETTNEHPIDVEYLVFNDKKFGVVDRKDQNQEYNILETICAVNYGDKDILLGYTDQNIPIYIPQSTIKHMCAHSDVDWAHIAEAIKQISIQPSDTYKMENIDLKRPIGFDNCVEINDSDIVKMENRPNRNTPSKVVYHRKPEPTSLINVGICLDEDDKWKIFTSFYGQLAPKEPNDPNLSESEKQASIDFWNSHALIKIPEKITFMDLVEKAKQPDFVEYLRLNVESVIELFPEMKASVGFAQNSPHHIYDVWEHTLHSLEAYKGDDVAIKLALLFHDIGKPETCQIENDGHNSFIGHARASADLTEEMLTRVDCPLELKDTIIPLIDYHDCQWEATEKTANRLLNKLGEVQVKRLLEINRCDIMGQSEYLKEEKMQKNANLEKVVAEAIEKQSQLTVKDLAISGKDLIDIGIKPGKDLGITLNRLLNQVTEGKLDNTKDALLEYANRTFERNNEER